MDTKKLIAARKEAERAVKDMHEGPLKVKAFEVLFSKLLEEPQVGGRGQDERNTKLGAQRKPKPSKDENSVTGRILRLREDGLFKELRNISEIRKELAASGWHYPLTSLSGPLQILVRKRELRRQKVKEGNKSVWKYSES